MQYPVIQAGDNALMKGLFDEAPIPMAVVGHDDAFVRVNAAYAAFLGYTGAEMVGKTIRDITHPDDWVASLAAILKLKSERMPIRQMEKRYIHKSGTVLWAELNVYLVRDAEGWLQYTIAQLVDITERKRIQESLQNSEERFRRILEHSPLSMAIVSMEGVIEYLNKKAVETFGYNSEDIPTMDCWWVRAYPDEVYREEVKARWMGHLLEAIANKHEIAGDEYRITCKDGTVKMVFVFGVPVSNKVFVMFNDITERVMLQRSLEQSRAELEQKVKERTAKLRALTGEMIRVEHRERRRIAHVLHEDLQQWLAAAKFRVGELHAQTVVPDDRRLMDQILSMMDKAIEVTRTLSVNLRPPVLFELGMRAVLEWLAGDMNQKFSLDVAVSVDPKLKPLSDELALFVFDSVRELLMNVTKHARVRTACVEVSCSSGDRVRVDVWDEGVGFDPAQKAERKFGLFSIWERADALGGQFDIQSKPGTGAHFTLTLPLREPDIG